MENIQLLVLANRFRDAIDTAKNAGMFDEDICFGQFPRGCCGDASDLLAQFLLEKDLKTYRVSGAHKNSLRTHAWLLTGNQIIIDITGDQFRSDSAFLNYDKAVYIGSENAFHKLFVQEGEVCENKGLDALGDDIKLRLNGLYREILRFI